MNYCAATPANAEALSSRPMREDDPPFTEKLERINGMLQETMREAYELCNLITGRDGGGIVDIPSPCCLNDAINSIFPKVEAIAISIDVIAQTVGAKK